MDLVSILRTRGPASPCDEIHPEGNTVDVAAQVIHLEGRPTLLFISFLAACIGFVSVLLIFISSFIGRPPKENGLWFRKNHGLKGWSSLSGIMILTLLFFLADAVFRFLRYRHYTVDIVYLWAEEVRDKPQSIAEFWLFILIFASCEEAAQLGNVAQRGGMRVLGQTARWVIVILAMLAFLAGLGVDLAHKYFLVNALDPSSSGSAEDPDGSSCRTLTTANTILIGVSIGVYGVMTVAGIYGTIIALAASDDPGDGKHHGIQKYRRYWSALIVAFLARSMLGLAFVIIFDWFDMGPYDMFSMIYAIVYAATTAVMFFCIAGLIRIPNPFMDQEEEEEEMPLPPPPMPPPMHHGIPMSYGNASFAPPTAWSYKQPPVVYTRIPSDYQMNRI
ncbi:uncharacterized protein Z520_00147 [Fonsecaea multimorphosa CBS 102226]|uniref:Uncharacterized protein n=1 Tax=Fonsecaea multimorphosa CBS 102226 TaxID=1442371 RepID=A0A0D2HNS1_9EURO|nr:uncharacterized protein Z520_00147 [Fonsecaea multimorphosa CBS 102226]KIY03456.1 hypothetical protein Z520_00147 [Fonsecaea multimorphosa CBS 102226]OAL32714.1 hypothetical protein AYO22_00188 [Fonsecaea multimorphosa]